MSNKDTYAKTYAEAFRETYPQMPAEHTIGLIEKATKVALDNIDNVLIEGAAFKLTSRKLGIKHTKTAIREVINS